MSVPRVSDFQAVTDAIKTLTAAIYECERAGELLHARESGNLTEMEWGLYT